MLFKIKLGSSLNLNPISFFLIKTFAHPFLWNFPAIILSLHYVNIVFAQEFDMKLQLKMNERQVVSNMFSQPSANQSWRKVLSMGNLLNGHEPILREIIFSMSDSATGSHYAASSPRGYQQDIETYRMYICGTSNDLRVALSVTSYD